MKKQPVVKIFRGVAIYVGLLLAACSPAANLATVPPTATAIPTSIPATVTLAATPTIIPATATLASTPTSTPTVAPAAPTLSYEGAVHLFDYDNTAPLDVQENSVKDQDGIAVHDISYAAHDPRYGGSIRGRISAYLVTPPGAGPFAGLVFIHWLGSPNGNRNEFLDQAVALAHQGAMSLLIEGIFPWQQSPSDSKTDRLQVINQVIELRRALDLLLAQPKVDPQRIGFVGHDYGAMFAGILAGVDRRVKAFVLMAGMGNFSDWSLKYFPATGDQGAETYRRAMADVDPIGYISHASPAALLFQFAQNDRFISKEVAQQFYDAGSTPKQILWYDADHSLNTDADIRDRNAWLTSQLDLAAAK